MQRTALLLAGLCSLLLSCSRKTSKGIAAGSPPLETLSKAVMDEPDYAHLDLWAAHPYKKDPSDSTPRDIAAYAVNDSTVDVFFLHPTTLTSATDTSLNASFDDIALNIKTDRSSILYQASVFNEWRVFAPRYRQAHYRNYFATDSVVARQAFDLAYSDVSASFRYYLDHFNNGRPIVIAAHSQGSTHARRLLKEFFDDAPLKRRLVAAYIIGMYVPADDFSGLGPCRDSAQTGCIVAWRTYKQGYTPPFVKNEKTRSIVTNPLTWTTTTEYAPYALNKGGIISDFSKLRSKIADAQVHDGILWINRPRIPGSIFLRMKNFHIGDINLFYMNIRQNLRIRIGAFWKQ